MKKRISSKGLLIYPIFVISISIISLSCNKSNEEQYSCDPQVNEWTVKYKSSFLDMTREQLALVPIKYQGAIYETFSPEKKADFWKEKINIVLSYDCEPLLKEKIMELYSSIDVEDYDREATEPPSGSTLDFVENWENYILENQLVDSVTFVVNFCTLLTFDEIDYLINHSDKIDLSWLNGNEELIIDGPGGGGGGIDCRCRYDIYCSIFLNVECVNGGCNKVYRCGVAGNSACNGLCEEMIIE
ncbi:MAG: bacteriocin fulvocin C-related protein [Bacteroidales bacterium]